MLESNEIHEIKKILAEFHPRVESQIKPEPKVIASSFTKKALSDLYKIKYFFNYFNNFLYKYLNVRMIFSYQEIFPQRNIT